MRKAVLLLGILSLRAAAGDAADVEFFEKRVRPVFAEHCYRCHSAASESVTGENGTGNPRKTTNSFARTSLRFPGRLRKFERMARNQVDFRTAVRFSLRNGTTTV